MFSKYCIFAVSTPIQESNTDRDWLDIHIGNGVFRRFGFGELESRKFIDKSRTKQQRTPHEVYYIESSLASDDSPSVVKEVYIYTNTTVHENLLTIS